MRHQPSRVLHAPCPTTPGSAAWPPPVRGLLLSLLDRYHPLPCLPVAVAQSNGARVVSSVPVALRHTVRSPPRPGAILPCSCCIPCVRRAPCEDRFLPTSNAAARGSMSLPQRFATGCGCLRNTFRRALRCGTLCDAMLRLFSTAAHSSGTPRRANPPKRRSNIK